MAKNFKIKIFSDGADINDMKKVTQYGFISGFTTNPSLMKRAGVKDYLSFAKQVVKEFPDLSISFEVFGTDIKTMKKEADIIKNLGKNVFVKIPIITTSGESTAPLIKDLSNNGVQVNVTAVSTTKEVQTAVDSFAPGTNNYVSIFVGRVADTGVDPTDFVKKSVDIVSQRKEAQLLWASTREVINVYQAQKLGVDIITVPPAILGKLAKVGKSQYQVSLDTVKGFKKDSDSLGFSILGSETKS